MLSIRIIAVGRNKEKWVTDQVDHYRKLIGKYASLEIVYVADQNYRNAANIKKALQTEAASIRAKLKGGGGYLIVLDGNGVRLDTLKFAEKWKNLLVSGHSNIEIVIGGPYGLDETFKSGADLLLSLSPLTMSHRVARLVLLEQLYRILNLNAGGKYHK